MAYNIEQEYKEITLTFEELLDIKPAFRKPENESLIRKAFDVAYEGHKDTRRKSGEPYIYHPIAVARIVVEEIGLGTTSLIAALLHDVVEDTDFTKENIENIFGEKIANIVDGLTKIKGTVNNAGGSIQSETLRKVVLTLSEDLRVIMVKLADRLHNLRTLGSMPEHKKLRTIAETQYLYAPLAHRLGLYSMKTELENLCFYHTKRAEYQELEKKINKCYDENRSSLENFIKNVSFELNKLNIKYKIYSRTKSIFSIWEKIHKKGIDFDEVFDLLAIRVIFEDEGLSAEEEKARCWQIFSTVTSIYKPKPDRIRDWISKSKANGYEALHSTFMSENARWIEVQIRSTRMHDIAEKGIAAHWKYKNLAKQGKLHSTDELDKWISEIKDFISNPDESTQEFLDVFKLSLYSEEIYTFTPKGEIITLPKASTVLDFAYEIHSELGNTCLAAKVNKELLPKNTKLKNGDLVEIITSEKERPKIEWLDIVNTAKAKTQINLALRDVKKQKVSNGKSLFESTIKKSKEKLSNELVNKLITIFGLNTEKDLYLQIAEKKIDEEAIKSAIKKKRKNKIVPFWSFKSKKTTNKKTLDTNKDTNFEYITPNCCHPIPGDEVMGFLEEESIAIHKVDCPVAIDRMSRDAKSIVKVYWNKKSKLGVLASIHIEGIDRMGIFQSIAEVISKEFKVLMRSINFDVKDEVFKGQIDLYVHDINHVNNLITKLVKIKGIEKVNRVFDKGK